MAADRRRGRFNSAAAEAVASHSDLLYEILVRLPPKSLLKFKKVCRQWCDLISARQFCLEHTRRNGNPKPIGVFLDRIRRSRNLRYVEFDKNYQANNRSKCLCKLPDGNEIIDCNNGLLVYSTKVNFEGKIYVCNPTTKQLRKIPSPFKMRPKNVFWIYSMVLAFDHHKPESYRLVCVSYSLAFEIHRPYFVDIYESETKSWRHSTSFTNGIISNFPTNGIFWNGVVYWLGYGRDQLIFSLDLKQECFRKSPLLGMGEMVFMGACQGHLYMFCIETNSDFSLSVYEMEQDHSHLSKKFSISYDALGHSGLPIKRTGIFMGEEDELFLVILNGDLIFTYNMNLWDPVPAITILAKNVEVYDAHPYSESLTPV